MGEILRFLATANFYDFIHNTYFLGLTGVVVILAIIRRSVVLPVCYFAVLALGIIVGRTIPAGGQGTPDIAIAIFSGGILAVVAVAVYFLLIKGD